MEKDMEIEIKSVQTIDGKKESIQQTGIAHIERYEKGINLSWNIPNESLQYKMTILKNKILLNNQNQNMVFELGKRTKSTIQTQYGNLNMSITTKHMEVLEENKIIKKVHLVYEISIQETNTYQNEIEIIIK